MLSDLLRALADPAPRSLPEIARSLGVTPDRLRLVLEHGEQLGYLDRGDDACAPYPAACGGCPSAGSGPHPGDGGSPGAACGPTWWRLTERGRRAAARRSTAG